MTHKYSPIIAMLLLAGAEVAAPVAAKASEAKAATLQELTPTSRVRCFMGAPQDSAARANLADVNHGWFCMPEKATAYTH